MKLILLTISVVSLLSACTTGEQMSRLEPGMTRQQVVGILGRPNAVRSYGPYEQLEYTHRLITGWSWDRSDFSVILKGGRVVEFGHGEVRDRTPQVVYMQSNAPSQSQPVNLSIPATTAAAVGQRASGGAANGATVVDESVRQLKGAGQVVTEHWRTMPEIRGRVMTFSHYGYD